MNYRERSQEFINKGRTARSSRKQANINEEKMNTEKQENGNRSRGSDGFMSDEEINKLADEGAKLLSFEHYCKHVLLEGTKDAIQMEPADKEQAWKMHVACLAKAQNEGRESTLNLEEYVQQAKKVGERTAAIWHNFLPLRADISDMLKDWIRTGRRLQKAWEEQTKETIAEWQQKAARIVELMFPPKSDTEPRESDVSNPFPLEALPPVIKNIAVSFSQTWEVPSETVALPMISVISGALGQGLVAVDNKGRSTYGNTFTYMSLSTGGFKTEAMKEALNPVTKYNIERQKEHENKILPDASAKLAEMEEEISRIRKSIREGKADPDATEQLKDLFREKQEQEKRKKFWNIQSSDATVEALARKGAHTGTLLVATDEASIVENIIAGRYSEGFTNEGFFCKIFSVTPYERERVKDEESISTPAICGVMLLMGQPHITKKMFQNEQMKISGFIPRFLFGEISSELKADNRNAPPINEEHRRRYNDLVTKLLKELWPTPGEQAIQIRFSDAALDALHDFRTEMVKSIYANRLDSVDGIIVRLKEQAMRLAVVLHAATFGESELTDVPGIQRKIGLDTVRSAIAIVRWSFEQYMSYNASAHEVELDALEKRILKFIESRERIGVSARDVSRKFRSDISTTEKAEIILRKLEQKGRITEIASGDDATIGRPKSKRYTTTKA